MILKYSLNIFFGFALIITGCSAYSSGNRYQTEDEKTEKVKDVRFSSAEDPSPKTIVPSPDSLVSDVEFDESDPDESPENETSVDLSEVLKKFNSSSGGTVLEADNSTTKEKLLMEIIEYLNTPYRYGGNSKKGIDCSAFTQTIYYNVLSTPLLRSARDQYTQGEVIENQDELQFGDLVFFNTRRRVKPGHVGIYIGDNLFAHASSKNGVIISSLEHDYYSKNFMGARRIENVQF